MEANNTSKKNIIVNLNEAAVCGRIGSVTVKEFTTKNGKASKLAILDVATNERVVAQYVDGKPVYAKDAEGKPVYSDTPAWHRIKVLSCKFACPFEKLTKGALVNIKGSLQYDKVELKNSDGTAVLRDGKSVSVTYAYILVDGKQGFCSVVSKPQAPAEAPAPAQPIDDDFTEM